ncbi:MAG: riboflavin synthase [Chloroflexi bacterium]|nr:riboflavin synthase [Chloroflexota bacterium]
MFTGIVEELGYILASEAGGPEGRLVIAAERVLSDVQVGDSVAVNGACLTVVEHGAGSFAAGLMHETLRRTNLGRLRPGESVNLERAVAASGRFGGHVVQGHVDGTARLVEVLPDGAALLQRWEVAEHLRRYIVPKGFVALDGTSLTVVDCTPATFRVALVSYTQSQVTLGRAQPGYEANIEVDILAKYVEALLEARREDVVIEARRDGA